jgi:hypothetical protein
MYVCVVATYVNGEDLGSYLRRLSPTNRTLAESVSVEVWISAEV